VVASKGLTLLKNIAVALGAAYDIMMTSFMTSNDVFYTARAPRRRKKLSDNFVSRRGV